MHYRASHQHGQHLSAARYGRRVLRAVGYENAYFKTAAGVPSWQEVGAGNQAGISKLAP